jgi:hypothetical protein
MKKAYKYLYFMNYDYLAVASVLTAIHKITCIPRPYLYLFAIKVDL